MRALLLHVLTLLVCLHSAAYFEQTPANSETSQNEAQAKNLINSYYDQIREAVRTVDSEAPYTYEASRARRAQRGVAQGYWINVDTRDQKACQEVYQSIRTLKSNAENTSLDEFCRMDPSKPMLSVLVFQDINAEEFRRELNLSGLKTTDQNMVTDTRNMALTMVGAMGLFWMLPESVTKWDKKAIAASKHGIFTEYADNIKKGPVIDEDTWYINWIGHPISGAAYYTMARHNNLSIMQSFGYSVMMSTFFWEYGFEAFAEIPSIQDLFITPIVGSLLGELFYRAEQSILAQNGKLMGSRKLGKLALVVLNPMGTISAAINRGLGSRVIQDSSADLVVRSEEKNGMPSNYIGVQIQFVFY